MEETIIQTLKGYEEVLNKMQNLGYIGEWNNKSFQFQDNKFLEIARECGQEIKIKERLLDEIYPYEAYFYLGDFRLYTILTAAEFKKLGLKKKEEKIA